MSWLRTVAAAACLAALPACTRAPEPDARFPVIAEIKGFDPAYTSDQYAAGAQFQVFEPLLEFHPLKRPFELMPCLAEAMPEESADHLVFTFRIRDALFQDDACFPGGKGRKVTAQDFVWCFKRLMAVPDSQMNWIFAGKIKGLDDWAARAGKKLEDVFDHRDRHYPFESPEMAELAAEEVPGLRALDDRTLRIELAEPYPQFLWTLTMGLVYPHEAVERYGVEFQNHPVGTGPYHVDEFWIFDRKITFVRNPTWHGQTYPTEGGPGDREAGRLDDAGRPLPFLDRVEMVVIRESQPRWLEFVDGRLDRIDVEKEIWERAMTDDARLKPDLVAMGVRAESEVMGNVAYNAINMEDPVIGQPAGDRGRKVRQAMSLAYDVGQWIRIMRNGHWGTAAVNPIPPTFYGYVDVASPYAKRDLARAKRLLEEAGYPGGHGLPTLVYEMYGTDTLVRNGAEMFVSDMKEVGIDVSLVSNTWDQMIAKINDKKAQLFGMSYSQDYPDAQDFLQLFYGPNEAPGPNATNYKNADYDALYKRMSVMPPGPERDGVIRKMVAIVNEDCPWIYQDVRTNYSYCQPWLKDFKYSDINPWMFKYCRVDKAEKARRLGGGTASQ
jgi:ABC-type transport system substrate-binding protein